MIWDTCMVNDELDMIECRLTELENIPNLTHVFVEADVDHQDHSKPYYLTENLDRFEQWKDRLVVVRATGLPTAAENPDPWAREHAQREFVREGLTDCAPDDVILHGDLDEIPREVFARNIRPAGMVALSMRCYSMAVDWLHPEPWRGTVCALARNVTSFSNLRDTRNYAPGLDDAGWHLGWLGGKEAQLRKLGSFCHPEIRDRTLDGIERNLWLEQGYHVDGKKLIPVEVDESWPRWIREGRCPESWFRPRVAATAWKPPSGF